MLKPHLRHVLTASVIVAFLGGWFCGKRTGDQGAPVSSAKEYRRALRAPAGEIPAAISVTHNPRPAGVVISSPPAAFSAVLKLNVRRDRESALEETGRLLAGTNVTEALRVAAGMADQLDREAFLSGVVKVWAAQDPDVALAYCLGQNFSMRCRLVPVVFAERTRSNPGAAFQALGDLPQGEVQDKATEAVFTTWSSSDPGEAARRVNTIKDGAARARILDSFAGEWAANDPPEALAWAAGLERSEDKAVAMTSALREFGRRYPVESLEWATEQMRSTSPLPGEMIAALLAEAGFGAPKEAFHRGLTFGDSPRVVESLAAVTSYYAEDQAQGLLDDFRKLTQAQQEHNASAVMFALGAASSKIPHDLFSAFTPPEIQQAAVDSYVEGLTFRDVSLAESWVRTLPEGPIRVAGQRSLEQPRGGATGVNATLQDSPAPR